MLLNKINTKNIFLLLLLAISICNGAVGKKPTHIIFDIGDTLVSTDKGKIAAHVGYWNGFLLWLEHQGKTKDRMTELLTEVLSDGTENNEFIPFGEQGSYNMPSIIRQWFLGHKTSAEVLSYGLKHCDFYSFDMKRERKAVESTLQWMFDPKTFADIHYPLKDAVKLVKELSEKKDSKGKPLYSIYIISNFDRETFDVLYKNLYNDLFYLFKMKNIEISGYVHDMKPRPSIFNNFMIKHNLEPQDCVFIDDIATNAKSALSCGMHAIRVIKHDYKRVRKHLRKIGVNVAE